MNRIKNYFTNSILPDAPNFTKSPTNIVIEKEEILQQVTSSTLQLIQVDKDKQCLVILDPSDVKDTHGISEESLLLLSKIMTSMNLNNKNIHYLKSWQIDLTQESLAAQLLGSNIRIVFLIGTVVMQHFLGKDKKISQVQGQIIDYSCQGKTFHFISFYHPDFIALNSSIKNITWNSIKTIIPWLKQQLPQD